MSNIMNQSFKQLEKIRSLQRFKYNKKMKKLRGKRLQKEKHENERLEKIMLKEYLDKKSDEENETEIPMNHLDFLNDSLVIIVSIFEEQTYDFVQNTIIWSYNPSKDRFAKKLAKAKNLPIDNKIEYFVTGPKPAFKDIIRSLTTYKKIENYSESKFYGVAYGHKKSAKGWQIVKTLTRNEVEEGIVQFQWENPEIELVFEPNFSCLLFAKQKEDKDRNVESKAS